MKQQDFNLEILLSSTQVEQIFINTEPPLAHHDVPKLCIFRFPQVQEREDYTHIVSGSTSDFNVF